VRRFDMVLPESVEECLAALSEHREAARVVAGGTDLVPGMKIGVARPATVIDLSGIRELREIEARADGSLRIGAAVSARALEQSPLVRERYPALAESAGLVGSVQVRTLATLGGNVCNAAPSADMAPPLLALDAVAVIAGPNGRRVVPFAEFFVGVRRTVVAPDEMLVEIEIPAPAAGSGGTYRRHTPRRELDIAIVGVASQLTICDGRCATARIALAAVAPTPVRARDAEAALEGSAVTPETIEAAARLAVEAAQPISDQRGSAEYRRHLVRVLTRRTLRTALDRAEGRAALGPAHGGGARAADGISTHGASIDRSAHGNGAH
jgi:aerobic carbon-monoxide dehydrogenase medium subunit